MAPMGKTTNNANHMHQYNVDKNGNGYTSVAVHPENPNIRHRHKVVNWVVQEAKSSCYPRCKDNYGVEGAPPHLHHIMAKGNKSRIRSNSTIARRFINNFNEDPTEIVRPPGTNWDSDLTFTMQSNSNLPAAGDSYSGVGTIGGMPGMNSGTSNPTDSYSGVGTIGGMPGMNWNQ